MKRLDIEAIEARVNAASPGPWYDQYEYDGSRTVCHMRSVDTTYCVNKAMHAPGKHPSLSFKENARFVAAARTDVPDLIAEVRSLQLQRDELLQTVLRLKQAEIDLAIKHAAEQMK